MIFDWKLIVDDRVNGELKECLFCIGKPTLRVVFIEDGVKFLQCPRCKHVYVVLVKKES